MNRAEKTIVKRLTSGKPIPTAFDAWDNADREIAGTIMTRPFDYTKKGTIVIFEYERTSEA